VQRNNCLRVSVALLFLNAAAGLARIPSGTLVGKVLDPTGASVPEGAIRVQEIATDASSETVTNSAGEYTVPYLDAGRYRFTVTRTGFVTARTAEIEIGTATTMRADVKLELGTISNIIEVSGTSADLQT